VKRKRRVLLFLFTLPGYEYTNYEFYETANNTKGNTKYERVKYENTIREKYESTKYERISIKARLVMLNQRKS
jgi:hypothetical protein